MSGGTKLADVNLNAIPAEWSVQGTGDFNGDGRTGDVVWRNINGTTVLWEMNGGQKVLDVNLNAIPTDWSIQGLGDFNGDGKSDIVWRNVNGTTVLWEMNGGQKLLDVNLSAIPTDWRIQGIGDFNGDGHSDIVWRNTSGTTVSLGDERRHQGARRQSQRHPHQLAHSGHWRLQLVMATVTLSGATTTARRCCGR